MASTTLRSLDPRPAPRPQARVQSPVDLTKLSTWNMAQLQQQQSLRKTSRDRLRAQLLRLLLRIAAVVMLAPWSLVQAEASAGSLCAQSGQRRGATVCM